MPRRRKPERGRPRSACAACVKKKTRCDGEQPCATCRRLDVPCLPAEKAARAAAPAPVAAAKRPRGKTAAAAAAPRGKTIKLQPGATAGAAAEPQPELLSQLAAAAVPEPPAKRIAKAPRKHPRDKSPTRLVIRPDVQTKCVSYAHQATSILPLLSDSVFNEAWLLAQEPHGFARERIAAHALVHATVALGALVSCDPDLAEDAEVNFRRAQDLFAPVAFDASIETVRHTHLTMMLMACWAGESDVVAMHAAAADMAFKAVVVRRGEVLQALQLLLCALGIPHEGRDAATALEPPTGSPALCCLKLQAVAVSALLTPDTAEFVAAADARVADYVLAGCAALPASNDEWRQFTVAALRALCLLHRGDVEAAVAETELALQLAAAERRRLMHGVTRRLVAGLINAWAVAPGGAARRPGGSALDGQMATVQRTMGSAYDSLHRTARRLFRSASYHPQFWVVRPETPRPPIALVFEAASGDLLRPRELREGVREALRVLPVARGALAAAVLRALMADNDGQEEAEEVLLSLLADPAQLAEPLARQMVAVLARRWLAQQQQQQPGDGRGAKFVGRALAALAAEPATTLAFALVPTDGAALGVEATAGTPPRPHGESQVQLAAAALAALCALQRGDTVSAEQLTGDALRAAFGSSEHSLSSALIRCVITAWRGALPDALGPLVDAVNALWAAAPAVAAAAQKQQQLLQPPSPPPADSAPEPPADDCPLQLDAELMSYAIRAQVAMEWLPLFSDAEHHEALLLAQDQAPSASVAARAAHAMVHGRIAVGAHATCDLLNLPLAQRHLARAHELLQPVLFESHELVAHAHFTLALLHVTTKAFCELPVRLAVALSILDSAHGHGQAQGQSGQSGQPGNGRGSPRGVDEATVAARTILQCICHAPDSIRHAMNGTPLETPSLLFGADEMRRGSPKLRAFRLKFATNTTLVDTLQRRLRQPSPPQLELLQRLAAESPPEQSGKFACFHHLVTAFVHVARGDLERAGRATCGAVRLLMQDSTRWSFTPVQSLANCLIHVWSSQERGVVPPETAQLLAQCEREIAAVAQAYHDFSCKLVPGARVVLTPWQGRRGGPAAARPPATPTAPDLDKLEFEDMLT